MLEEVRQRYPIAPLTEQDENRHTYPLLRLRIDYTGYSTCNAQRFGQRFVNKVANPSELLQFFRRAKKSAEERAEDKTRKAKPSTFDRHSTAEVPTRI